MHGTSTYKYKTFQNISQPTEFFDTVIVFIKIFMIILMVLLLVLSSIKAIHKYLNNKKKTSSASSPTASSPTASSPTASSPSASSPTASSPSASSPTASPSASSKNNKKDEPCNTRLCKAIDNINDILYHMILIIYFIIAIVVILAFHDKALNAVKKGRVKLGHIMSDIAVKTGLKKPDVAMMTTNEAQNFSKTAIDIAKQQKQKQHKLPEFLKTLNEYASHLKTNEMKDYAMSLVFWNQLFLLPVYAGLYISRNTDNAIVKFWA